MITKDIILQVDKSNEGRLKMCVTCKHESLAQDLWPCSGCWNPMGDMYESKKIPVGIKLEAEVREISA